MKKFLHITLIIFILLLIYIYQCNFKKINPYDAEWIYWDNNINISKTLYQIIWEKNTYLILKNTLWKIKLIESSRLNIDKFLVKKETISFVKDFILIAPNFTPFQKSVWYSVLYNYKVSESVKNKYSKILYNLLKNINTEQLSDNKDFLYFFDKEINYCKENNWNYPLKKELSKIYWHLWIYEMFINKNELKTFCNFLYSWYWLDIDWWYENVINNSQIVKDFSLKDFWRRLKLYYKNKFIKNYKRINTNSWIILNDWEMFYKKILNINKNLLNKENINNIKIAIWEK